MNPEEWTMGDSIAAWIFMMIPLGAGIGLGRLVHHFRVRDEERRNRDWY